MSRVQAPERLQGTEAGGVVTGVRIRIDDHSPIDLLKLE